MQVFEGQTGERIGRVAWWVLVMLGVFLTIQVIASAMQLRYIGAGVAAANTISVSGHGEASATPDIATFSFSVVSDKSTVAAAQADATAKQNAVDSYLKSAGINDKDIQTSGYSVYPQYDYNNGTQTFRAYEVRQTTTVKVRDITKAGDVLAGVVGKGVTEVNGPSMTFDDPTKVQADARQKAIDDAKQKADVLAKQLGVSIVRVVSFSESGGGTPGPIPYAVKAQAYGMGGAADSSANISAGENKVTDDVSVTYEIR